MRMEVRCCCQPQKLLGTVEVPDGTEPGHLLSWILPTKYDEDWITRYASDSPVCYPIECVQLTVDVYVPNRRDKGYPAVKAEGVPLKVLRRIPTFVEAVGYHNLPKELLL